MVKSTFSLVDHENYEAQHIRKGTFISRTTCMKQVGFEFLNRLNSVYVSWIIGVSIEIGDGLFNIV